MEVQNKETKEIVEAVKNEDGTYTVEGQSIPVSEMATKYAKVKAKVEPKKEENINVVESTSGMCDDDKALGALFGALAGCQGEFVAVEKGSQAHKYNYADINAVLTMSSRITSKFGLSITQLNLSKLVGDNLLVGVKTILGHESGGWIASEIYVPAVRSKSNTLVQMAGVNITYLRRYGIQSILGLATTDNDGSDK